MKATNSMESFLYWISGTAEELILQCKPWVQRLYLTLGVVFLLNLVFLSIIWVKVCANYFGLTGILPGLIIPAVFVLGIDRIIAMRPRALAGALKRYDIDSGQLFWEFAIRIFISLALSLVSTFTFQLNLAQDLIHEASQAEALSANAKLRQEYAANANALTRPKMEHLSGLESSIMQQRVQAQHELDQAASDESRSLSAARIARQEQHAEAGGLDIGGRQRSTGFGPRYHAQREIADMYEAASIQARETRRGAEARLDALQRDLAGVHKDVVEAQRQHQQRLEETSQSILEDERYVRLKRDLFSDSVIFLEFFSDPHRAKGVITISLFTFLVLMTLELCSVLVLYLLPQTEYDVLKNVTIIREATRLASTRGMEEINADLRCYETFTASVSDSYERAVRLQEEKILRARLQELNAQLRGSQAQNLASLDVRLPGLAAVEVQPSANNEYSVASPEQTNANNTPEVS